MLKGNSHTQRKWVCKMDKIGTVGYLGVGGAIMLSRETCKHSCYYGTERVCLGKKSGALVCALGGVLL